MRFLPTRIHGMLDYLVGLLLMASPLLFHLPSGIPSYVLVLLGCLTIAYSFHTRYEWGVIRIIPMRLHLLLDLANGLLLAATPWLFGFQDIVWRPYLIIAALEILVTAISDPNPSSLSGASAQQHLK